MTYSLTDSLTHFIHSLTEGPTTTLTRSGWSCPGARDHRARLFSFFKSSVSHSGFFPGWVWLSSHPRRHLSELGKGERGGDGTCFVISHPPSSETRLREGPDRDPDANPRWAAIPHLPVAQPGVGRDYAKARTGTPTQTRNGPRFRATQAPGWVVVQPHGDDNNSFL